MSKNKFKIGEFSRLCGVTVRALRHYEEIGLLAPDIVDCFTGYRYYSVGQMQKLQGILQLKDMGFSLREIRNVYDDDTHMPLVEVLEEKIRICDAELDALTARKKQLEAMIAYQKKKSNMEKIFIESLPAIVVATHRTVIHSYEDLGSLCCEVIGPEMVRLGCECPEPGYCYTVEHGGYKPNDIDIEYCEMVSSKGEDSDIIKFKEIAAVPKAVCMKVYGPYNRLHQNYMDLFAWMEKEGYQITGAPRASYVDGIWNQEDPEKWLTIIQVPVKD